MKAQKRKFLFHVSGLIFSMAMELFMLMAMLENQNTVPFFMVRILGKV
jgi:hypothetical protein